MLACALSGFSPALVGLVMEFAVPVGCCVVFVPCAMPLQRTMVGLSVSKRGVPLLENCVKLLKSVVDKVKEPFVLMLATGLIHHHG